MNDSRVRVLLPDGPDLVACGLRGMLSRHADRIEIVDAGETAVDVEIVDAGTDGDESAKLAQVGRDRDRRQLVLVDDGASPRLVRQALGQGAAGLLVASEPADVLADALVRAASGSVVLSRSLEPTVARGATRWPGEDRGLSRRESQVLVLIAGGSSPEDIVRALGIAHETVRSHLKRVYHKLGVRDRATAVARAWNEGIVDRYTIATAAYDAG